MNPNKRSWEGEIVSVGSAKLGTFKKFIPFNAEEGYHIPQIIFDELKNRKCTIFVSGKGPRGEKITKSKLINEFALEVLPPLGAEELKVLASRQALANGGDI